MFLCASLLADAQSIAVLAAIEKAQEYRSNDPKNVLAILSPFGSELTDLSWEDRLRYQHALIEAKSDLGQYLEAQKDVARIIKAAPEQYHANADYLAILYKNVFFHLQMRDIEAAVRDNKRLLQLGLQHGDLSAQVQAHLNNEIMAMYKGDWERAHQHVQQAYTLIDETDWSGAESAQQKLLSKVRYELARLYRNVRPQEAMRLLREALALDEAAGDKAAVMSDLNHLAILAFEDDDYATAFTYSKLLEKYALELNKKAMLMSAYTLLSQLYLRQNNLPQADIMLRRADMYRPAVQSNTILSRYMLQQARLAIAQKRYTAAVNLLQKEEASFFGMQEPLLIVEYYGLLGEGLAGQGHVHKAYETEKLRLSHYKRLQALRQMRLIHALSIQFEKGQHAGAPQPAIGDAEVLAPAQQGFFSWRNIWVLALALIALLLFILRNFLRAQQYSRRMQSKYRGEMMPPHLTLKRLQHTLERARSENSALLVMLLSNRHRWFDPKYFQGVSVVLQETMPKGSVWGRLGEGQVLIGVKADVESQRMLPSLLQHRLRADRRRANVRHLVSIEDDNIEALLTRLLDMPEG